MRALCAIVITVIITVPSLQATLAGQMTPDDFGLRVFLGALFAIIATGVVAAFIDATYQPPPKPKRRKTDQQVAGEPQ